MRAFNKRIAIVVASAALTAWPGLAFAQRQGPAGGGGGGGNGGGGGAANVGSGGTPSSAGSASSGGSSSGGGTASSSSPSFGTPASGFGSSASAGNHERTAAPVHRTSVSYSESGSPQHSASSSTGSPSGRSAPSGSSAGSGNHATPRASSGTNPGGNATAGRATAGTRANTSSPAANNASGAAEVPSWSRARGSHPPSGTAVARTPDHPAPGTPAYYAYINSRYGYYNPYYYDPNSIYGFYGLGGGYYGFYNPYYAPYGFGGWGLDPGFGVPYYGDPTDPYSYGESFGAYSSRVYSGEGEGALKLKVKPRDGQVYVDGYLVGTVDQFDGMFQKLTLNGGSHKVEIKANGYETAQFDVLITPKQTLTFEGDLKKLQ